MPLVSEKSTWLFVSSQKLTIHGNGFYQIALRFSKSKMQCTVQHHLLMQKSFSLERHYILTDVEYKSDIR
ncbi:hypothetical protein GCM10023261_03000 [Bartonella jaculi]|uniref:Uncharacterized protein n=1 Tax=Bartonella jaculi TaxID=686226 RepID=A0ABP9N1W8_9HYPH